MTQVAPFWHGLFAHSSTFAEEQGKVGFYLLAIICTLHNILSTKQKNTSGNSNYDDDDDDYDDHDDEDEDDDDDVIFVINDPISYLSPKYDTQWSRLVRLIKGKNKKKHFHLFRSSFQYIRICNHNGSNLGPDLHK